MDKAKAAVSDFISKSGHHDTTVHEKIAPAVSNETVKPTRHEHVTTAVDREVHQDHHHTTVQPVHAREVLPEKHHHNVIPVEHKTHDHRNQDETRTRLETEAAKFKNITTTHDTKHTQEVAPVASGEHIHHHVHETVQPIVHKEVIAPEVIHTVVPVHETHHETAKHHTTTELPSMTMEEFNRKGGALTGREERHAHHDGCPDPTRLGDDNIHPGHGHSHHGHDHSHSERTGTTGTGLGSSGGLSGSGVDRSTNAGPHNSNMGNKLDPRVDSDMDGRSGTRGTHTQGSTAGHIPGSTGRTGGSGLTGSSGLSGSNRGADDDGITRVGGTGSSGNNYGSSTTGTGIGGHQGSGIGGHHGTDGSIGRDNYDNDTTTTKKPSLLQRLNPMKDADGDGKKGMMD